MRKSFTQPCYCVLQVLNFKSGVCGAVKILDFRVCLGLMIFVFSMYLFIHLFIYFLFIQIRGEKIDGLQCSCSCIFLLENFFYNYCHDIRDIVPFLSKLAKIGQFCWRIKFYHSWQELQ